MLGAMSLCCPNGMVSQLIVPQSVILELFRVLQDLFNPIISATINGNEAICIASEAMTLLWQMVCFAVTVFLPKAIPPNP